MDPFDPTPSQIYHPISTGGRMSLRLKCYPFSSYSDNSLKGAVYEIWVCN